MSSQHLKRVLAVATAGALSLGIGAGSASALPDLSGLLPAVPDLTNVLDAVPSAPTGDLSNAVPEVTLPSMPKMSADKASEVTPAPAEVAQPDGPAQAVDDTTTYLNSQVDGARIYEHQQILPSARANVVVVHGLGEHSGRYDYVAQRLLDAGFNVYRMDHRGHGLSAGPVSGNPNALGDMNSFSAMVDDVNMVVQKAKAEHGDVPTFLLGHSMGALAVQYYGIKYPNQVKGIVSNGGGAPISLSGRTDLRPERIVPEAITETQKTLPATSSEAVPMHQLTTLDADFVRAFIPNRTAADLKTPAALGKVMIPMPENDFISTDEAVLADYRADPLVPKQLSAQTLTQLMWGAVYDGINADKFTAPTLVMHGTKDNLVPSFFSENWFNSIASADKTFKFWEGQKHEVFNEPAKHEAMTTVIDWLNARI